MANLTVIELRYRRTPSSYAQLPDVNLARTWGFPDFLAAFPYKIAMQVLPIGVGAVSAPFQVGVDLLALLPDAGATAIVSFGTAPAAEANGIVVQGWINGLPSPGAIYVEPMGQRLAVV